MMESKRAQRIFQVEEILCDTVMVDTCHHTLVQTQRIYNIRKEP